ncbi:MAG: hypothetical protein ACYC1Z_11440 [Georgenia sp.]
MTLRFGFHPETRAGFVADVAWYDDREFDVGARFEVAVRRAIDAAVDAPGSWVVRPDRDRVPVVRRRGSPGRVNPGRAISDYRALGDNRAISDYS